MASWRIRGSWAKRTISSAVTERGLTATSIPARSKTSIENGSWTIPIVKPMPCTLASIAAYRFFASSRIAKTAARACPIRSRSMNSESIPEAQ